MRFPLHLNPTALLKDRLGVLILTYRKLFLEAGGFFVNENLTKLV
jgi:hypothetical protein